MDQLTLRDPLKGEGPGQGLPHPNSYWAAISGPEPDDDGPLIGDHDADDTTVSYALGYQGSGVAAGLHGRLAADRLAGKPLPDLGPALSPLPRFPFAAFRRAGQRAAFAWYRVRDERA